MDESIREKLSENQVYLGINPAELYLLESYRNPEAQQTAGFYTDFSGVRTRLSYFGAELGSRDGAIGSIPFPDDGVHAEAIEYLAAIKAVNAASGASFTAVELGAGYGPWLVFSAKAAMKKGGIKNINLIAVEADLERHGLLKDHFRNNGLPVPDDSGIVKTGNVSASLIYGAVSDVNGEISFGSQDIHDWGAAPIEGAGNVDYRGFQVTSRTVKAYTIERIIQELDSVDFLHIDIQGFEYRSITASIKVIRQKVRFMLVATHSRKIEGELFDLLYDEGWRILNEKPCKFRMDANSSLEALTYVDGAQLWVNTDLVPEQEYMMNETERRLKVLEYRSWELEAVVAAKDGVIAKLENALAAKDDEIARIYSSTSWLVTTPLRVVKRFFLR
jgi:FkbM family methyltransferase